VLSIEISREPVYYTTGFQGLDVEQAPLYLQALAFDGQSNDYGARLILQLNQQLSRAYPRHCLQPAAVKQLPRRILIINTSNEYLPLPYETRRIWEAYIYEEGWDCITRIVNSRRDLLREARVEPAHTLIFSQCGCQKVYDIKLYRQLTEWGVTVIPGPSTAPGGTVNGLDAGKPSPSRDEDWQLVAHYRLGRGGIVLESMYGRRPPEPTQLAPLDPRMVEAVGGKAGLYTALLNGAEILIKLVEQAPAAERQKVPLRLQVELAPSERVASKVKGDAARGLCLATRWSDFINHSLEWLKDGLSYYNWRRERF
jgi:hypothetical protein